MKTFLPFLFFALVLLLGNCQEQSNTDSGKAPLSNTEYLQEGKMIASATFVALSSELQQAMQKGGIQNAVNYCKLAAVPLVDSLSKVHEAEIRRTALRVRNSTNKPSPSELKQLQVYQAAQDAGEALQPTVQEIDANTVAFYAPIQMMPLCEKCHGTVGETLAESNYDLIKNLYPDDEAVNFSTGELRGMWSIRFQR